MDEDQLEEYFPSSNGDEGKLSLAFAGLLNSFSGFVSLPKRVQQDLFKAFGRLLGVPVAWLEGRAAKIRAETGAEVTKITAVAQAEKRVIDATGKALAAEVTVSSDTADFANRRFQNMILRHHENARQIVVHAVDELRIEPVLDRDDVQISDDWLNIFEREAVEMSSEQMQRLFGKVLAGELRKPGSYSIKTVRTLAQLDNRVAALFLLLSNLTSVLPAVDGSIEDARVICFGTKVKYGGLGLFGLDYDAVVLLQEHGLVIPEYDTGTSYSAAIIDMEIDQCRPFRLCGRRYTLAPHLGVDAARFTQFHVSGLQLTTVGRELLDIVTLNEEQGKDYMAYLEHHFKGIGVDMVLAD